MPLRRRWLAFVVRLLLASAAAGASEWRLALVADLPPVMVGAANEAVGDRLAELEVAWLAADEDSRARASLDLLHLRHASAPATRGYVRPTGADANLVRSIDAVLWQLRGVDRPTDAERLARALVLESYGAWMRRTDSGCTLIARAAYPIDVDPRRATVRVVVASDAGEFEHAIEDWRAIRARVPLEALRGDRFRAWIEVEVDGALATGPEREFALVQEFDRRVLALHSEASSRLAAYPSRGADWVGESLRHFSRFDRPRDLRSTANELHLLPDLEAVVFGEDDAGLVALQEPGVHHVMVHTPWKKSVELAWAEIHVPGTSRPGEGWPTVFVQLDRFAMQRVSSSGIGASSGTALEAAVDSIAREAGARGWLVVVSDLREIAPALDQVDQIFGIDQDRMFAVSDPDCEAWRRRREEAAWGRFTGVAIISGGMVSADALAPAPGTGLHAFLPEFTRDCGACVIGEVLEVELRHSGLGPVVEHTVVPGTSPITLGFASGPLICEYFDRLDRHARDAGQR